MAAKWRALFSLYIEIENFKKFVRNYWTYVNIILQKSFYGDPLLRLCKPSWFVKRHVAAWGQGIFPISVFIQNNKILLVWNHWTDVKKNFSRNVSLVTLYQDCSIYLDSAKPWPPWGVGRGLFSLYIYIENFKTSRQKPLDRFQYNKTEISIYQKYWTIMFLLIIFIIYTKILE